MGQEFFIKSSNLESKVRQLLPSQGGSGAGFDLSASTQIIPIVDLTESAEGSNVRADIQKALSFENVTAFNLNNVNNQTLLDSTGYWRLFGVATCTNATAGAKAVTFNLFDSVTSKIIYNLQVIEGTTIQTVSQNFDFIIKLNVGISLRASASNTCQLQVALSQVADIDGNLN